MTRADMDRVRDDFVAATQRAAAAGADWLELHCAHGYLLSSFLSPLTNRREDEYGGSHENRARYPLEVFGAMRAVWPEARPMSVRLSCHDWTEGGNTPDDAAIFAAMFKAAGADLIDCSSGQVSKAEQPVYGRLFQTPFADQIRNEVGIGDHRGRRDLGGRPRQFDRCGRPRRSLRDRAPASRRPRLDAARSRRASARTSCPGRSNMSRAKAQYEANLARAATAATGAK